MVMQFCFLGNLKLKIMPTKTLNLWRIQNFFQYCVFSKAGHHNDRSSRQTSTASSANSIRGEKKAQTDKFIVSDQEH